jgi:hypothetical protein
MEYPSENKMWCETLCTRQIPEVAIIVKTQGQDAKIYSSNIKVLSQGTMNTHMKYKSPITYHSKDMAEIKDFKKWIKLQGQGHKVKNYSTIRKVLS